MLSKHPAFVDTTHLHIIAKKYNVNLINIPKFHCELNPIEGFWCSSKQYVRKRTDQKYETMIQLIGESKKNFQNNHKMASFESVFGGALKCIIIISTINMLWIIYMAKKQKKKKISHRKIVTLE